MPDLSVATRLEDGTVEAKDNLCCFHAMGDPLGKCCPHCSNCSKHKTTDGRCCHHKAVEDWGICCPDCTECDREDQAADGYGPGWRQGEAA